MAAAARSLSNRSQPFGSAMLVLAFAFSGVGQGCSRTARSRQELIRSVLPCVVSLESSRPGFKGKGVGAGFIVKGGELVTAAHLVASTDTVTVRFASGATAQARVADRFPQVDTAVLSLPESARAGCGGLTFQREVAVGNDVIVVGSPAGLAHSVSAGIVSAKERSVAECPEMAELGLAADARLIQTDAAISSGTSGGPLLNAQGEVLGMVIASVPNAQRIGLAVTASTLAAATHLNF